MINKKNILKNFYIQIVIKVIVFSLSVYLSAISFFYLNSLFLFIFFLASSFYFIFNIISFFNKTNYEIIRFLESIKYSDFSQTFNKNTSNKSFDKMGLAFQNIINKFKQAKKETQENYKYLQTVTHHISVGLISFNSNGKIELLNNAAKKILKVNSLLNINDLNTTNLTLLEKIRTIKSGEKISIKLNIENDFVHLFLYSTEFRLREQNYKLVAIQNIQNELDENEMASWQKLIRVLTHEIMNSVTPISSLSSTANDILKNITINEINQETVEDLNQALITIKKRSDGLINFVNKYRDLTKIPKPSLKLITTNQLLDRLKILFHNEIVEKNISIRMSINPPDLKFYADPDLIEQVLINLILNSIQAVFNKANPLIEINVKLDENSKIIISIKDNGIGIEKENLDKIFIPFFSTKKEGSGIGLSLSREIIRLHRGTLTVFSKPDIETIFYIKL